MKYKILEKLHYYFHSSTIQVSIDEKYLTEKENIFDIEETRDYFLEIEEMGIKKGKLDIVYSRPNDYKPLFLFKDYENFYKLDIVSRILEVNVLEETKTFISMTNILMKDTKNIQFIYKADDTGQLPFNSRNTLEQYKQFIYSFFGKYTLEKYQKDEMKYLEKENNSFLNKVASFTSLNKLQVFIQEELTKEQQQFFSRQTTIQKQENSKKNRSLLFKVIKIGAIVFLFIGTIGLLKQKEKKELAQLKKETQTEITFLNKVINNDSKEIDKEMKKLNFPKEKQVSIYIQLKDYQKAYELDKNSDKKIVQQLYSQGKKKEIEQLNLEGSQYLDTMKKILAYKEPTNIEYIVQIEKDPLLIEAVIDKAIEKQDVPTLQNIKETVINSKQLPIENNLKIKVIDTLIEYNSKKLEEVYENTTISKEQKQKNSSELIEENNQLLIEKSKLIEK